MTSEIFLFVWCSRLFLIKFFDFISALNSANMLPLILETIYCYFSSNILMTLSIAARSWYLSGMLRFVRLCVLHEFLFWSNILSWLLLFVTNSTQRIFFFLPLSGKWKGARYSYTFTVELNSFKDCSWCNERKHKSNEIQFHLSLNISFNKNWWFEI